MSPLEPLAPDQRAVVSLVLQQGRSYDEIADLLGLPAEAVRARAQAGLAALARDNGLPAEVTAPLADYLLGQQQRSDADATRGLLAESAPARAWAADVAAQLEDVAPRELPPIPGPDEPGTPSPQPRADDAAGPPGPRPPREASDGADDDGAPAASRLGGALLITGVLAVVAVVLFVVLRGGDDQPADERASSSATPAASATPTPTAAAPQVADTIRLRPASGGKASGTMTVYLQGDQLLFELVAEDVPPSRANSSYAVWLTGPGAKARRLGFTDPVGADGKLGIQGPGSADVAAFPRLYATYANVVVSEETSEAARRPGRAILIGTLPQGR